MLGNDNMIACMDQDNILANMLCIMFVYFMIYIFSILMDMVGNLM